jgi:hypothetical protein
MANSIPQNYDLEDFVRLLIAAIRTSKVHSFRNNRALIKAGAEAVREKVKTSEYKSLCGFRYFGSERIADIGIKSGLLVPEKEYITPLKYNPHG